MTHGIDDDPPAREGRRAARRCRPSGRSRKLRPRPSRRRRRLLRDGVSGGCRATPGAARSARCCCGWSSFTPSLLPRGWLIQGIIAGITAAIGYGLGVTVAWFVRSVTDRRPSAGVRRRAWQVLAVAGPVLTVVMLWLGQRWQREIHLLMGLERRGRVHVRRHRARGRARLRPVRGHRPGGALARAGGDPAVRPDPAAQAGAAARRRRSPPCWSIFLVNGVLFQGLVEAMNSAFSVKDSGTEQGAVRPTAPERSGSPDSLVPWEDLGLQGRNFVGKGPTPAELRDFSGRRALEPVRVYTGLASADYGRGPGRTRRPRPGAGGGLRPEGARRRHHHRYRVGGPGGERLARVRVQRRHRDGRRCSTPTCRAGCRSSSTRPRRATPDGPCSTRCTAPGRSCRCDRRPQLYVFGESLGTFGGEAAFSGLADIENRTDGVLWAGPPNFNELWRSAVGGPRARLAGVAARVRERPRSSGSPIRPPDLDQPPGPWGAPAGGLPAERLGPHRLVVPEADPGPPGLAARRAWAGREPVDGLDPLRHVLAGHGRPGVRGRACPTATGTSTRRTT